MISNLKVTKGTVVRTVLLAMVLVNIVLKAFGMNPVQVDERSVVSVIENVASIVVIVLNWWKNNSFSDEAKNADFYLQKIRNFDTDEADEVFEESGEEEE